MPEEIKALPLWKGYLERLPVGVGVTNKVEMGRVQKSGTHFLKDKAQDLGVVLRVREQEAGVRWGPGFWVGIVWTQQQPTTLDTNPSYLLYLSPQPLPFLSLYKPHMYWLFINFRKLFIVYLLFQRQQEIATILFTDEAHDGLAILQLFN